MNLKSKKLTTRSALTAVLVVATLFSLYRFFYTRKHDYNTLLESLRTDSFSEIIKNNDPFRVMWEISEEFDSDSNSLYVATYVDGVRVSGWEKYQIEYYFYPEVPQALHMNDKSELEGELLTRTESGDVVIAVEKLDLDEELFSCRKNDDHFIYVRK